MTVGPQMEHTVMQATSIFSEYRCDISLLSHAFPAKRQGASAKKLQLKAADILPLDGLARFKQDPINRGYCAQNRPPPAVALLHCIHDYSMHGRSWGAPSHVIHMKENSLENASYLFVSVSPFPIPYACDSLHNVRHSAVGSHHTTYGTDFAIFTQCTISMAGQSSETRSYLTLNSAAQYYTAACALCSSTDRRLSNKPSS